MEFVSGLKLNLLPVCDKYNFEGIDLVNAVCRKDRNQAGLTLRNLTTLTSRQQLVLAMLLPGKDEQANRAKFAQS